MTGPEETVTDVCGDCDGRGFEEDPTADILGDVLTDCLTCGTTGFVEVPAIEDDA
jgi:hypothetical protein